MFGHDWEHGTARVIDRELLTSGGGETPGQHRYVVEVEDPTGEPFRGEIKDPTFLARNYLAAKVGEDVAVLIDYKHKKVKLDKDDPSRHSDLMGPERAAKARFEAELAAPPGSTKPATQKLTIKAGPVDGSTPGHGGQELKITINGKDVDLPTDTDS
jgi:hypothetical protein